MNQNGYIVAQNDEWTHDFRYWVDYLAQRGMKLSLYYNPFWITQSARADRSIRVAGRPDIAVADLTADWDPSLTLGKGRNLVLVTGTGTSTRGPVHLDSISVG